MYVDAPANGARVLSTGFHIGGWAIDAAATGSTGVDAVHVHAYPIDGGPWFVVAIANYGISRPDVGAAFGGSRFTGSGFSVTGAAIPPGTYNLAVYARSIITGTFNNAQVVRITVEAPPSNPRMWVDYPQELSNLSENIFMAGWAIDLNAANNTGMDAVHVWGFPQDGSAPILVGVAELGQWRPDVGAAFGSAKFNNSGWSVRGTLPRGQMYTLVAYAHSSVANAWVSVFNVVIRVN